MKLCFRCLSSEHEKQDNFSLYSKEHVKGGNKFVHTVRVLPLEASSKFLELQVCNMDATHECYVAPFMWIPSFGPYGLV